MEIGRIAKSEDGKAIFFDFAGVRIVGALPISRGRSDETKAVPGHIVQKFVLRDQPIFVDCRPCRTPVTM